MRRSFCHLLCLTGTLLIAACSTEQTLRPDGSTSSTTYAGTTAHFSVPAGWQLWKGKESHGEPITREQARLERRTLKEANRSRRSLEPIGHFDSRIEVLFGRTNSSVPATQQGQAEGYLYAIHHHSDDDVKMEPAGAVQNVREGPISVFHFSSDYFGYRLDATILHGELCINVELQSKDEEELTRDRPAFEAVLQSVATSGVKH